MNRRRVLLGIGAAITGSAAAVGTGAFSGIEADRSLTVNMVEDSDAYLQFQDVSSYAGPTEDGIIQFTFDGDPPPNTEGDGLGVDSVYEFSKVVFVENQGDRPVKLFSEYSGTEVKEIGITQSTDINKEDGGKNHILTRSQPSDPLAPGDNVYLGFVIDTEGMATESVNTSLEIVAISDTSDLYE